ncbi:MAG: anthranilate phosphoribosyltransferase [Phycisphaerales bacterium]|nr:anthranilate phosphoribosyltransferase [Phycisphaerales bacterium]
MEKKTTNPSSNDHAMAAAPSEFAGGDRADLTPHLRRLLQGDSLDASQTTQAFEAMMTGNASQGEMGALLALLATRTPTPQELYGAARVMRDKVDRVVSSVPMESLLDTAGTGGAPKTFNVSTLAAIVAAGSGVTVAKHGNKSRTGRGSAEVLQALGVDVDAPTDAQGRALEEAGICFCFAPRHHPATRYVMPVRQALGFPTIFNLLGPLTNPAGAGRQVVGVYEKRFLEPVAETLLELGTIRAAVMHSCDGYDEVSIGAATDIMHVEDKAIRHEYFDPTQIGISYRKMTDLMANDLDDAADIFTAILDGKEKGPRRDLTLVNAALALVVAGKATSMSDGVQIASTLIDNGQCREKLDALITWSKNC